MAKKQKQKAKQAARKAGKGSALVKKKTIQQQPGGSGKRMLVPKHAKQGKARKPVARPVSSEKLALKARRREEQAARERAKAAEYAKGPAALRMAKRAILDGLALPLAEAVKVEAEQFGACFATEDCRTGVQSFMENGPGKATFAGR